MLLFGQSAGATNAFTVATLPEAPDLIRAAAFESGSGRDAPLKSSANAIGEAYASALDCGMTDVS